MKATDPTPTEDHSSLDSKVVVSILDEAADIRAELNNVSWKDFAEMQKGFAALFSVKPSDFKRLNDLVYYQGGYPSPSSPAKHKSCAESFAKAYKSLFLVGKQDLLTQHLAKFGLKVVVENESKLKMPLRHPDPSLVLKPLAKSRGLKVPKSTDPKVVALWFVDYCQSLQGEICAKANIIKKELYSKMRKYAGDIRRADFRETVAVRVRKRNISSLENEREGLSGVEILKRSQNAEKRATKLDSRLQVNRKRVHNFVSTLQIAAEKEDQ